MAPYRMALAELDELKAQLDDLKGTDDLTMLHIIELAEVFVPLDEVVTFLPPFVMVLMLSVMTAISLVERRICNIIHLAFKENSKIGYNYFFISSISMAIFYELLLLGVLLPIIHNAGAQSIGVCNGRLGNNLPSEQETVDLYKSNGIGRMRIYDPNQATLQALRGSNIELILDVPNGKLQELASDASAATQWVQMNVQAYSPDVKFRYISVGNEVDPNTENAQYVPFVLPAMKNVHSAIVAAGLQDQIKVSTATYSGLLGTSYPPSNGAFQDNARSFMEPIISFLASNTAPLLANIYPYFAYIDKPQDIQLPYALFTAPGVVVTDGSLGYQNLFDALLDAMYTAVEKVGGHNLEIVVSESGWPSEAGTAASVENASTYYRNLINHVKGGTPKKPDRAIQTFLFAMFDENQKPGKETEKHFGLFSPNKQPKYQIAFS
ncbi:glucan endo-1,3-beta-glucosidase-like [Cornus florida]|uniref:glucan endo-1,3-beta-glucosidase-like n=1 Tax=Cornus florida TaxID=4283 RepID=UPI00289C9A73|nr:glucan endo-1,3-beta-glucosidase-like [Cornus florida]